MGFTASLASLGNEVTEAISNLHLEDKALAFQGIPRSRVLRLWLPV